MAQHSGMSSGGDDRETLAETVDALVSSLLEAKDATSWADR
jgi:hypothetical protein